MSKQPTTVRLDPALHKQVVREAKKAGLSFSSVVHLLLRAFTEGTVHIGVSQYPERYMKTLDNESKELSRLHREGKVKGYASSRALFDAILDR